MLSAECAVTLHFIYRESAAFGRAVNFKMIYQTKLHLYLLSVFVSYHFVVKVLTFKLHITFTECWALGAGCNEIIKMRMASTLDNKRKSSFIENSIFKANETEYQMNKSGVFSPIFFIAPYSLDPLHTLIVSNVILIPFDDWCVWIWKMDSTVNELTSLNWISIQSAIAIIQSYD